MVSNTAVPKYYGEFRNAVLRGEIPVCQEISMQMNLIDKMIADPRYYYDSSAIDGYISFCENELTLTDGTDLVLMDAFKLWAEDLLSWFEYVEFMIYDAKTKRRRKIKKRKRVKNKIYIMDARGSAKTMFSESLQAYFLVVYPPTTHQIVVAPTMKQAEETMSPIRTALIRRRGPVINFMTKGSINNTTGNRNLRPKLCSTKMGIQNFVTNSLIEIKPMSIDKLQGFRPFLSTVDEILSCDIREDVLGAIEQGASKLDNYIIVLTSSEGTVRNGIGDTIKTELYSILKQEYFAPHISVWMYKLDSVEEVAQPEMWAKANTGLGITISYETYHKDVARMEANPTVRNDILAKRFGLPMTGYTYFFTYDQTLRHNYIDTRDLMCAVGADMSQGDDFCSYAFLFPLGSGRFVVVSINFVTDVKYETLHPLYRAKYNEFIQEGSLIVMPGPTLNMSEVYKEFREFKMKNNYGLGCLGYDIYNSEEFIREYTYDNGDRYITKVVQGARTESVPLGEIRNTAEERKLIFYQKIMEWSMGNAIAEEDGNGNRKLSKQRSQEKIDPVAALVDAWVAKKRFSEVFD